MKAAKYALAIFPILYILLGYYFQEMTGLYSLRSIDPEYIYFISGLSVANGQLELGHIDNPGTPLQFLLALLFRIIYAFRPQNVPFIEDALANSDMYLTVSNLITIVIIGAFLFYAGKRVYNQTRNIGYALLIQTTPFLTGIVYGNMGRVTPENILPIPAILLCMVLIKLIIDKEEPTKNTTAILSLIGAFGLSIKLTFLPLLIIPFFSIKGWKNKLLYSGLTPIFFFCIALPATLQIETFWNWVKALFFNSGQYGKGEGSIINLESMIPNISKMWNENDTFFFIFIAFFLVLVLSGFVNNENRNKVLYRIALGIIIAILIQVFLVSKHFEQRYFVNVLFLIPLMIISVVEASRRWHLKLKRINIGFIVALTFILSISGEQLKVIQHLSGHLANQQKMRMPALHYFKGIEENAIKVFVPGYYNCPSPEYALRFSYGWAGKQKVLYEPYLAKLFPNSILYYFWDGSFNFWGEKPELNQPEKSIYVYLEHYKHLQIINEELKKHLHSEFILKETFKNTASNEVIYKVEFQ